MIVHRPASIVDRPGSIVQRRIVGPHARLPRVGPIVPAGLGAIAALTVLGFLLTLHRVPTLWPDSQLYASIARSRQLDGIGVPSALWFSPFAVDHIPFYGPVYFDLVAQCFNLFGMSLGSFRLVSVIGALMIAAAAAVLGPSLSGDRRRWIWPCALVLLTPELGTSATNGTMETLAVGFELMALALFVRGLTEKGSGLPTPFLYGVASGGFLMLAALTTPRTYPFIAAFLASGFLLAVPARGGKIRVQIAIATAVLLAGLLVWAVRSQGSPTRWVAYMTYIFSREDTDVAILNTAVRDWAFNWSALVTPAFACLGVVYAARLWRSVPKNDDRAVAVWLALGATLLSGVLTFWSMDLTFTLGVYFAVPLLVVVLSLPRHYLPAPENVLTVSLGALVALDLGVAVLRYARVAATWAARNPAPLTELIRSHVPAGSAVVGPDALYFVAVESIGARYRSFSDRSLADWTRWVPSFDPTATQTTSRVVVPPPSARFLILQTGQDFPDGYACAGAQEVGHYVPPPNHLDRLGRFGDVWDVGYPATILYRLPPGCPTGYDPTERHKHP